MRRLVLLTALLGLCLPGTAGAVVNGSQAAAGEFPWQVAVMRGTQLLCGGTVLDEQTVLTAAHCLSGRTPGQIFVRVNDLDRTVGPNLAVADIANHPETEVNNDPRAPRSDVALLRLAKKLETFVPLEPVAQFTDDLLWATGKELLVSGWGATSGTGGYPAKLRWAALDRWSDDACAKVWAKDFDALDQVCALRVDGTKVIDACRGDSGGPLVAPVDGMADRTKATDWRLVGVVSYGTEGCDGDPTTNPETEEVTYAPGVYARVGADAIHDFVTSDAPRYMPYNTVAPELTGEPTVGEQVTCSTGTWQNGGPGEHGTTYSYEFWRGSSRLAQAGSSPTRTVSARDAGSALQCVVVARNAGGTSAANSKNALAVQPLPDEPVVIPEPEPIIPVPGPPEVETVPPPAADTLAPLARLTGRACTRRGRCTIAVNAVDQGTAGVRTLVVTLSSSRIVRCGRELWCKATRRFQVTVRRISDERFQVLTGALPPGRYALSVRGIDMVGNEQHPAAKSSFRIKPRRRAR